MTTTAKRVGPASWVSEAEQHVEAMNALLYPMTDSSATLKARMHAVRTHPIYNFMHTYYRYSAEELKLFTPGANSPLDVLSPTDSVLLHPLFQHSVSSRASSSSSAVPPLAAPPASTVEYRFPKTLSPEGRFGWIQMAKARDVLKSAASLNPPNFGCFGLHEWAMLYKGAAPKQPGLGLRVSQSTIDAMVEGGVKCSHYDAFRFFHQDAKQFNAVSLVRETQASFEQAACIHVTMDLFKWSHKIYPPPQDARISDSSKSDRHARFAVRLQRVRTLLHSHCSRDARGEKGIRAKSDGAPRVGGPAPLRALADLRRCTDGGGWFVGLTKYSFFKLSLQLCLPGAASSPASHGIFPRLFRFVLVTVGGTFRAQRKDVDPQGLRHLHVHVVHGAEADICAYK